MGKPPGRRPGYLFTCAAVVLGFALYAAPAGVAEAQSPAAFTAHYEHLAQVETELLARAQALTPAQSARGAAVAPAVATLNTNITSLYTDDQALSATGARPLPLARLKSEIGPALREARAALAAEIQACTHVPSPGPALHARLAALALAARNLQQQLGGDLGRLNAAARRPAFRKSAALESDAMQGVITRLQTAAISLTDAWLALADATWAGSQPATIQGLAYTSATIAAPAKGQAPVTDTVGVQPTVTDASGQVLPDTGTYRLRGPANSRGVSVDRLIGSVTVHPGATPGQYTITYSQGRAREQVILQVTP